MACGMFGSVNFRIDEDELVDTTAPDVRLENFVGVEKVAHYQIKAGKMIGRFRWKLSMVAEEARKRTVFNRTGGLRIKSIFSQRDDMFVADDLDVGIGKTVP